MEFGGKYKVRERGLFDPSSKEPFRISRTKIEMFGECPRCLYLDVRHGVMRPETPAFTLNNAIDELFKREFDIHRDGQTAHPLMKTYGIDAVPFAHEELEAWRDARRRGITYVHKETNLLVCGGIDDVWKGKDGELIIVDYKATSKRSEISLYEAYKRQAEVYQWLFRRNGFKVSDTAYFVYANGNSDAKAFDGKLEFDVQIIPHKGGDSWIEPTLYKIRECLDSDEVPEKGVRCDYCPYREAAGKALIKISGASSKKEKVPAFKKLAKENEKQEALF
jgi:CRISPR/Cas system-associated exonuclease Cas4 (RecB family)